MEELAGLLSRERLLLELLLFKLVTLRQLLVAGEVRFLPWAAEEVDRATTKVREAELRRSIAVEGMAGQSADAETLTLRTLAENAPEPWRTIFAEHRRAYLGLATDLEDALAATRRLAETGGAAVTATLDRLTGSAPSAGHLAQAGARSGPAAAYGAGTSWQPANTGARFTRTL